MVGATTRFVHVLVFLVLVIGPGTSPAEHATTNEWATAIGSVSDSSPAVGHEGTIYFGTWNGKLWALDPNGTREWFFQTGVEIKSAPAVGKDGTLYFGCRDRKFYAVGPNGKKKWEFKTGGWVDSSPALAQDGTICFGSWDENVYALNPDGSKRWQFQTGGPIVSSPAIDTNGTIYFGSHDRKFYALSPTGEKKWEFATRGPIISSPALDWDGNVYLTSVDGFFYALDRDGHLRWKLHTGSASESSPVIGTDGKIYVGANKYLWAITPDGKKKWDRGVDDIDSAPAIAADATVYFIYRGGLLNGYNQDETLGDRWWKWTYYLYYNGYASPSIGTNGSIYLPGIISDFTQCFIAVKGDAPLAKTPWPKFRGNLRNTGNLSDSVR